MRCKQSIQQGNKHQQTDEVVANIDDNVEGRNKRKTVKDVSKKLDFEARLESF